MVLLTTCLCVLFCGAASAQLTVEIVWPDEACTSIPVGELHAYVARAFWNGAEVTQSGLYEWDFGDGSPVENGNPAEHTFTTEGSYNVSVTVTYSGQEATGNRTYSASSVSRSCRSTNIMRLLLWIPSH